MAYAAKKGEKWVVIIDGQPGPEYDRIIAGGPTFHADGVLEYLAVKKAGEKKALYRVKHVPVRK